ncbi:hypothetical protein ACHAPO_007279 [Fusarium lateritium]
MSSSPSLDDDRAFLESELRYLCEFPDFKQGQPRALFGHITIPPFRGRNILDQIRLAFPVDPKTTRFFLVGSDEDPSDEVGEGELAPERLDFGTLVELLRANMESPDIDHTWCRRGYYTRFNLSTNHLRLPRDVVFLLQLDPQFSAECALALALIVDWALSISSDERLAKIRVITLSPYSNFIYLHRLLLHETTVAVFDIDLSTLEDPVGSCDFSGEQTTERIVERLVAVTRRPDKSARLIVSFDDSIQGLIRQRLDKIEWEAIEVDTFYYNDKWSDAMMSAIENLSRPGGTVLVTIYGQLSVRPRPILAFSEVHVVLGHTDNWSPAWDNKTLQVIPYPHLTSRQDRQSQLWWAYHPKRQVTVYNCREGPDAFVFQGGKSIHLMQGAHFGAFIASMIDFSQYGLKSDVIIERLIPSPLIVKEMIGMLTVQGLVANGRLTLSDQEAKVFHKVMPVVRYDYRLAMFLALDSDPTPRRVKAQFAAAVLIGNENFCGYPEGKTRAVVIETVFKCCHGYGSNLAKQGSTWLDLGLAKYGLERQYSLFPMPDSMNGAVDICMQTAEAWRQQTGQILERFHSTGIDISINTDCSREREELTAHEQWQIHYGLFRSFMYQVTLCRNPSAEGGGSPNIRLFRSNTSCTLFHTVPTKFIDIKSLLEASCSKMILGISYSLTRSSPSNVEIRDWVMIPANVIAFWENETGLKLQTAILPSVDHEKSNDNEVRSN